MESAQPIEETHKAPPRMSDDLRKLCIVMSGLDAEFFPVWLSPRQANSVPDLASEVPGHKIIAIDFIND